MLQQFYSALPEPLQHLFVTAQGVKYHHWRYTGIFPEYISALQRPPVFKNLQMLETTSAPAWGGVYIWSLNAPIVFRARRTGSSGR